MSKSNKNQKSITSFFKNSAQSSTNDASTSKPKSSPIVETKKDEEEEELLKLPSKSPSPAPAPTVKELLSPQKPTVMVASTIHKEPTYDTEWINLSDRFLLTNRNFDVQYAHLYAERLGTMRKMLTKAAENRWGLFILIHKQHKISYFYCFRFKNTNKKNE
jgi:hypothetical protein